jgi:hypothetical protein
MSEGPIRPILDVAYEVRRQAEGLAGLQPNLRAALRDALAGLLKELQRLCQRLVALGLPPIRATGDKDRQAWELDFRGALNDLVEAARDHVARADSVPAFPDKDSERFQQEWEAHNTAFQASIRSGESIATIANRVWDLAQLIDLQAAKPANLIPPWVHQEQEQERKRKEQIGHAGQRLEDLERAWARVCDHTPQRIYSLDGNVIDATIPAGEKGRDRIEDFLARWAENFLALGRLLSTEGVADCFEGGSLGEPDTHRKAATGFVVGIIRLSVAQDQVSVGMHLRDAYEIGGHFYKEVRDELRRALDTAYSILRQRLARQIGVHPNALRPQVVIETAPGNVSPPGMGSHDQSGPPKVEAVGGAAGEARTSDPSGVSPPKKNTKKSLEASERGSDKLKLQVYTHIVNEHRSGKKPAQILTALRGDRNRKEQVQEAGLETNIRLVRAAIAWGNQPQRRAKNQESPPA